VTNNLPAQQQGAGIMNFEDPAVINTIRTTVAKDANDQELFMFLHLCKQYQLDPFRKEIWFIKFDKSSPTIMTSRDGYLKIAQQNPDFQGLMSQEVRANDYFEMLPATGDVVHKFAQPISNRGGIVGAWATAHRKGVKPVSIFVNFEEYKGSGKIWAKYPSAMIIKVAEAFVLKRQFSITGLVTREEMDGQQEWEKEQPQQYEQQATQQPQQPPEPPVEQKMIPTNKDIQWMMKSLNWEPDKMSQYITAVLSKYGQAPQQWTELSPDWKVKIFDLLQVRLEKLMGGKK
jgi:phage recombination protein Bet